MGIEEPRRTSIPTYEDSCKSPKVSAFKSTTSANALQTISKLRSNSYVLRTQGDLIVMEWGYLGSGCYLRPQDDLSLQNLHRVRFRSHPQQVSLLLI